MAKQKEAGTSVPSVEQAGAKLMYTPLDAGDPHTVHWNGHIFRANVPKSVTDPGMIEQARGNPHFSVDGKRHKRVASDREPIPPPGSDHVGDVPLNVLADDRVMIEGDDLLDGE